MSDETRLSASERIDAHLAWVDAEVPRKLGEARAALASLREAGFDEDATARLLLGPER